MLKSDRSTTKSRIQDEYSFLGGVTPSLVISAIKDRASRWRQGDTSPDGRKLGLVIEGGAMRAVCSAGGAVALAQLGFSELFDAVYATSAGVMNASYFISNQPLIGIAVYFDCCVTRRFLNPWRFWKILNVDYIFDTAVRFEKPLDVEKVLQSRPDFFVSVIDRDTGGGCVIDAKKPRSGLLQVLKAATAIPVLYNRTVRVDGRHYLDGGMAVPFPLQQAVEDGCTDVLVLLTRSIEYTPSPAAWWQRWIFNLICSHGYEPMNRAFSLAHQRLQKSRDLALGRIVSSPAVNIASISTGTRDDMERMTSDRVKLRAAAVKYGRRVMRLFGEDAESWDLPPLDDPKYKP